MAKFSVIFFVLCTLLILQLATAHPADDNQSKEHKADAASGLGGMFGGIGDQAKKAGEDASKSVEDAAKAGKDKMDDAAKKLKF